MISIPFGKLQTFHQVVIKLWNGPYITVKFEGKTQEQYDAMKATLREILKKHPEIDWSAGVNTHALD